LLAGFAVADESVPICYGYGCIAQAQIRFSDAQLDEVRRQLALAVDAENERKLLAAAIGRLYGWAGEQSDIRNDRGGNYADGHAPGRDGLHRSLDVYDAPAALARSAETTCAGIACWSRRCGIGRWFSRRTGRR
jgi:hypothetical protein